MKNVKLINYDLIMVSLLLVSTLVTSFNIVVLCSSQPELMNCYPESEDKNTPTIIEPREEQPETIEIETLLEYLEI